MVVPKITIIKGLLAYILSFLLIFDLLVLQVIADSRQTWLMHIIFSLIFLAATSIVFSILYQLIMHFSGMALVIFSFMLLYFIGELAWFVLVGTPSFFGLFEKPGRLPAEDLAQDMLKDAAKLDIGFSLALLMSCFSYVATIWWQLRKHPVTEAGEN